MKLPNNHEQMALIKLKQATHDRFVQWRKFGEFDLWDSQEQKAGEVSEKKYKIFFLMHSFKKNNFNHFTTDFWDNASQSEARGQHT